MGFEDYLPKLLPAPVRGVVIDDSGENVDWGERFARAVGKCADDIVQLAREGTMSRLPLPGLSTDALNQIGVERSLPRGAGENDTDYAAYLRSGWEVWQGDNTPITGKGGGGGSHLGMLNAIKRAGIPTGSSGATIVQQNGRFAQLDGSGELFLGLLSFCQNRVDLTGAINSRPGWTFDHRGNFYSVFGIVFPSPVSINAAVLNRAVESQRPSKCLYVGAWVINSGALWGWPVGGGNWGSGTWGGDDATFIPGAKGDHARIGYSFP